MVKVEIILIGTSLVARATGHDQLPSEVENLKKLQVFLRSMANETGHATFEKTYKDGIDAGLEP